MNDDVVLKELAAIREELKLLRFLVTVNVSAAMHGGSAALAGATSGAEMTARSPEEVMRTVGAVCQNFRGLVFELADQLADVNAQSLKERIDAQDAARSLSAALTQGKPS